MLSIPSLKQAYLCCLIRINSVNDFLARYNKLPRWSEHLLFWLLIGWATWGQFARQFVPVAGLNPDPTLRHLIWSEQLTLSILSFWVLGYVVIPRYWYTSKAIQSVFFLLVYWLVSSALTEAIFRLLAAGYPPVPRYIQARITLYDENSWSGYFSNASLFFFNWAHNFSYVLIPLLIKSQRDKRKRMEVMDQMEQDKLSMELNFLRSQINPHFLFNAFNNLYGLIRRNDKQAPTILADLSDLMRYALYHTRTDFVPLTGELQFLANYLRLESIRFMTSRQISCTLAGNPAQFAIPPMILVCFIENAFKHGLNTALTFGFLLVELQIDEQNRRLIMHVSNSIGPSHKAKSIREGGIGIANVRKRLDLLYGSTYTLTLTQTEATFEVKLELPLADSDVPSLNKRLDEDQQLPFPFHLNLSHVS